MAIEKAMTPLDDDFENEEEIEVEIEGEEEENVEEQAPQISHYANLAQFLDENELMGIGNELKECFNSDDRSREEWLRTYIDGLDYLGFSTCDRQKPFEGASGVYHPVLSEAVVRFQSNAIVELFPAAGPVLTKIMGQETPDKFKQAQRVKEELNYQLTENMSEFRDDTERLLFRLPLAGSVFKKTYFDPLKQRPVSLMVPAEDFVVDNEATDICNAERFAHVLRRSKNEYRKLVRAGFYLDQDIPEPQPYVPLGKKKEDDLTGEEEVVDKDPRHVFLEYHVNYNLPGAFSDPDGVADPYIITIDMQSCKVLSIRRNWAEGDETRQPEQYFTHYEYLPGLGFYAFGLIHLLGSIAKSTTSILRQLIDAGTLANLPGGLKTKGLRTRAGDKPIQPGEWRDVDVPSGQIKDNLFPLPYKEPSATLAALLDNLVEEGRRIGSIADIEMGSASENAPVGTTLALMERSLKVMSAVHARLHASMRRELKIIAKVIAEFMPSQYDWDETGEFDRRVDFDGRVDVLPVSDPNAATQAQKIVQLQAVMQLAQQNPELYNLKELHRKGLQAIGIKDSEAILPPDEDPPRLDPVQENMAILTSQPVKVYQEQDHEAHIKVHMSAMTDPMIMEMVGQSPNAPRLQGQMEAHIAEHLAFQYRADIEQQMGVQLPAMGESLPPEVEARLSRLVATAADRVREIHKEEMQQKQAEEVAKDPVFQLREREVALKERAQQHKETTEGREYILDIAKEAAKEALDLRRIESEEYRAGAKIGADLVTFGAQLESEERREGVKMGKEIAENIRDAQMTRDELARESAEREKDRMTDLAKARMSAQKAAQKSSGGDK